MATFYISRQKQFLLMIDGCIGHDTVSRERRAKIAREIKEQFLDESFDPTDAGSYDLSELLEKLNDEDHADIFESYLNTY